ncbi:MAG: class flavin-dependent oxidoreductase, partial [Acidimicrobiaceae bacterium]|nr:class flavin-dependent oxidoreductase [Acidimicrobiaceae bacterium]
RAPTVQAWLDHWLDNIAANRVRPLTLEGYRSLVRPHLGPRLGKHRLDQNRQLCPKLGHERLWILRRLSKDQVVRVELFRRWLLPFAGPACQTTKRLVNHHRDAPLTTLGLDVPALCDDPLDFYPRWANAAVQAGVRNLWVGDHLLWHKPRFEQFTLLGLLCALTDLTLSSGITLAPLRQPWWIAKSAASIQMASRGGLILGLGAGGEYPREFSLANVPSQGRGSMIDLTVEFCLRAWAGHEGRDFSPLLPAPVPILLAGRKPPALLRAAHLADGWLGIFLDPLEFSAARAELLTEAQRLGRPRPAAAMTVWVCADRDETTARDLASAVIAAEYGLPSARFSRHVVAGTPERVAAVLAEYAAAGADHLDIHLAHPDPLAQLELLGPLFVEHLSDEPSTPHPLFAGR